MGAVYEECLADIDRWRQEFQGRPQDEMHQLWLLALERESIVSVAYREGFIKERLDKLSLPDELKELISHALLWAWKDEEMHAIYIRGALSRRTSITGHIKIAAQEISGLIGGWASAVQQNLRWREAPISRLLAEILTLSGVLLGKVSRGVRGQLTYHSFYEFCQFNIDAERTAVLVWSRLVELVQEHPELQTADFTQMMNDEEKHAKVFSLFADALTSDDQMKPDASVESLKQSLRQIDEFFLPPRHRTDITRQRFAEGAPVYVTTSEDKHLALEQLLESLSLDELLAKTNKPTSEIKVAIKPAFMMGYDRSDPSPLTDPELLDALCERLNASGVSRIFMVENTNHYDRFFQNRAVQQVADYFLLGSNKYTIVDASRDQVAHRYHHGMAQYTISKTWRDADIRISFGKLRSHPTDMAHLTMRNLEGLSARCEQFLFSERQAQLDTTLMMTLHEFPPDLAILDAFDNVADGVAGILGTQAPIHPKRLYGSEDAFALDIAAMRHCNIKEPLATNTLREARQWFGAISASSPLIGTDEPMRAFRNPKSSGLSALLSAMAFPMYSIFSGRGSLFVPPMDPIAFPLIEEESFTKSLLRKIIRALLRWA